MKKQRSSTLIQRLGFDDNDIKTQTHDQIMMWLNENIKCYPNEILGIPKHWIDEEKLIDKYSIDDCTENIFEENVPDKPSVKIKEIIWEYAIISKNINSKFVSGFIDMAVKIERPYLYISPRNNISYRNYMVFFEVKTKIQSLGELIRQIRFYEEYKQGKYFVVSPESQYASLLIEQGIGFVLYDKDRFVPDEAILPDGTKIIIPPR